MPSLIYHFQISQTLRDISEPFSLWRTMLWELFVTVMRCSGCKLSSSDCVVWLLLPNIFLPRQLHPLIYFHLVSIWPAQSVTCSIMLSSVQIGAVFCSRVWSGLLFRSISKKKRKKIKLHNMDFIMAEKSQDSLFPELCLKGIVFFCTGN